MCTISKIQKRQKIGRACLAMLLSAGFVAFVWFRTGIYFETNDDRYLISILSGVLTGEPDAHGIHVNYLLSAPLSMLYRITTRVPWYGGMLVLLQWLVYGVILDSACTRCRRWFQVVFATAMAGAFFFGYYYYAGLLEFTSTAALLAMGGYTCLLLRQERRTGFVWFLVLELLGCLLRRDAMLMIQPLGLAALAILIGENSRASWKEKGKKILAVGGGIFLILCLSSAGNLMGYQGQEWKHFKQFNEARSQLFDYYGKPEYEEVAAILDEYGISREKYEAYGSYMIMDWKPGAGPENRLAAYAAAQKAPLGIGELLQRIYNASITEFPWKICRMTVVAWGIFLLWTLLNRQLRMLFGGIVLLGGARMAVWTYLAWRGRYPMRVKLPLVACEVLLLLVLVWRFWEEGHRILWKKAVVSMGCMCFWMLCMFYGWRQIQYVEKIGAMQEIFTEGLEDVFSRCQSQPENRYLLDANSLSAYSGSAFQTSVYHPINAVFSGGWFSGSPSVQRRLEEYLGEADGFYFLIYMDGNQENSPQFRYLVQEMGMEPELTEQWPAAQGGAYGIYYFQGSFPFSK